MRTLAIHEIEVVAGGATMSDLVDRSMYIGGGVGAAGGGLAGAYFGGVPGLVGGSVYGFIVGIIGGLMIGFPVAGIYGTDNVQKLAVIEPKKEVQVR